MPSCPTCGHELDHEATTAAQLREWCAANGRIVSAGDRVDTETAAAILERSPSTLVNWRSSGQGPVCRRGGKIRYRLADLAAYIDRGIAE